MLLRSTYSVGGVRCEKEAWLGCRAGAGHHLLPHDVRLEVPRRRTRRHRQRTLRRRPTHLMWTSGQRRSHVLRQQLPEGAT